MSDELLAVAGRMTPKRLIELRDRWTRPTPILGVEAFDAVKDLKADVMESIREVEACWRERDDKVRVVEVAGLTVAQVEELKRWATLNNVGDMVVELANLREKVKALDAKDAEIQRLRRLLLVMHNAYGQVIGKPVPKAAIDQIGPIEETVQ